jgi:methyl-accepting chemotaxis protein
LEFQVDSLYINDAKGRKVGHIEIALDVTELTKHRENESLIEGVRLASRAITDGSRQIADGAQSLSRGTTEQSAVIQQLSSSVNEIKTQTEQNADVARVAATLSTDIRGNAEKGNNQMSNMMHAVKEINDASNQIGKVIKVIDDIAFQTNILALNAAVEAARAGQHGKGFAVVAEEVRNLASKSAEAAKDTGGLIENSIEKAQLGLDIATETSESLREIVDGINKSAQIVAQIAESSDKQTAAISQLQQTTSQSGEKFTPL